MSRAAANIFAPSPRSEAAPTVNRHGYSAWDRPLEEQFLQVLLTNTMRNTFYAKERELVAESMTVHDAMLAKDPEFYAQALGYARNRGLMRTQPVLGLVKASKVLTGEAFARVFDAVVRTPNDLFDFFTMLNASGRGEGGRRIKRVAGDWLVRNFAPPTSDEKACEKAQYWAVKYGGAKTGAKGASGGYSLKGLLRTIHPATPKHGHKGVPLFEYIMGRGENVNYSSLPAVEAFELLKRATTDEEKIHAIHLGGLPHEVASSFAGKSSAVWAAVAMHMPVFALLRNLATLERHGLAGSQDGSRDAWADVRVRVERMFSDQETVQRSKILPFRFMEAEKHVESVWIRNALRGALELAFENLPAITGDTAVLLDCSPSMKPGHRSDDMMTQSAIFAVAAVRKCANGQLICFDGEAHTLPIFKSDSVLTQAQRAAAWGGPWGGTNQAAAIDVLLKTTGAGTVDNIVIVTDGEQNQGRPFVDALDEYRKLAAKEGAIKGAVKTFIVDVSVNGNAIAPSDPQTMYLYGWSAETLGLISMASRGWGSMVDVVRGGNADVDNDSAIE